MFLFDEPVNEIVQNASTNFLWLFFSIGYLTTILIETPVLIFGLSPKVSLKQKILCGIWLTACTYPMVVLVLPAAMQNFSRFSYLLIAELFAHFGECVIFWFAFRGRQDFEIADWIRCFIAILAANFASFSIGEVLNYYQWFGLF
ncbi:MAG: hypothetical protein ACR2GD_13470 [Pyrinomonadaceae bacterium]